MHDSYPKGGRKVAALVAASLLTAAISSDRANAQVNTAPVVAPKNKSESLLPLRQSAPAVTAVRTTVTTQPVEQAPRKVVDPETTRAAEKVVTVKHAESLMEDGPVKPEVVTDDIEAVVGLVDVIYAMHANDESMSKTRIENLDGSYSLALSKQLDGDNGLPVDMTTVVSYQDTKEDIIIQSFGIYYTSNQGAGLESTSNSLVYTRTGENDWNFMESSENYGPESIKSTSDEFGGDLDQRLTGRTQVDAIHKIYALLAEFNTRDAYVPIEDNMVGRGAAPEESVTVLPGTL